MELLTKLTMIIRTIFLTMNPLVESLVSKRKFLLIELKAMMIISMKSQKELEMIEVQLLKMTLKSL